VAFHSTVASLAPGDANHHYDVFVHDRRTGRTEPVSVTPDGNAGNLGSTDPSISAGGRYVAFESDATDLVPGDANGAADVFVRDRLTGRTARVSVAPGGAEANNFSHSAAISGNGRFVAFASFAKNLVPGPRDGGEGVFVHDRRTGQTNRASVNQGGAPGDSGSGDPSISSDGRFVAFSSSARNLVAGDTNGAADVFVRCR
jgi:Tol biopolymer transport system component